MISAVIRSLLFPFGLCRQCGIGLREAAPADTTLNSSIIMSDTALTRHSAGHGNDCNSLSTPLSFREQREERTMAEQWRDVAKRVRNWGKWGPQDQLGTLNYITPEKVLRAAGLVCKGRTIPL